MAIVGWQRADDTVRNERKDLRGANGIFRNTVSVFVPQRWNGVLSRPEVKIRVGIIIKTVFLFPYKKKEKIYGFITARKFNHREFYSTRLDSQLDRAFSH